MELLQKVAVFGYFQGRTVENGHGIHQRGGVADGRGLIAGVHGELGQTDVRRGDGNMVQRDVAQGGAAGDIRPVAVGLDIDARLGASLAQDGGETPSVQ